MIVAVWFRPGLSRMAEVRSRCPVARRTSQASGRVS